MVQPGADPLAIHRHFLALGPESISYLLPSDTHDTVAQIKEQFGPTPCADFLIPIFDEWFENREGSVAIREFRNLCRLVLGGITSLDYARQSAAAVRLRRDRRRRSRASTSSARARTGCRDIGLTVQRRRLLADRRSELRSTPP